MCKSNFKILQELLPPDIKKDQYLANTGEDPSALHKNQPDSSRGVEDLVQNRIHSFLNKFT